MKVYFTKNLKEAYPEFKVGYGILKEIQINNFEFEEYLRSKKKDVEKTIKESLPLLLEKSREMDKFFKELNAPKFPISSLLEATAKGRSLKLINPLVDIVLFTELTRSILMGLHDLDKIKGNICFDILATPIKMFSLFGKIIELQQNDIIIKDEAKIFASLTKGPDNETKVTMNTKNIVIFAFIYPSIKLKEGVMILKECIEEIKKLMKVKIVEIGEI